MGCLERLNVCALGLDLGNTLMRYGGVPLDWSGHYAPALRAACARLGWEAGEENLRRACGRLARYNTRLHPREEEITADVMFADVMGCFGAASAEAVEVAVDAFFGYFRRSVQVFEDALPFLSHVRAMGLPAGILTDVPYGMPARWAEQDAALFRPYVQCALSSVQAGFRKPNAAGFLALAHALGVAPGRMAYVGDEEKDVVGAKKAGMAAVLIDRSGAGPSIGEDIRIACLDELI